MALGKSEKEWDHTALICFQLANMLNFSGAAIPIETFNPHSAQPEKRKSNKVRPSTLKAKVEAHVSQSKRNRKPAAKT